jgi:uncharacterized protein YndB with AHSA1/START domain
MKHLHASVEIGAPTPHVWALLTEFRHWSRWGPSIRAVESDAESVAVGVRGRIQTVIGGWLPFEITAVEQERRWDWTVAGLPATRHFVVALSPSRTRAEISVSWLLAPYVAVLHVGLRRIKAMAEGRRR